jgi:ABC-type multidrug transport system fused ATPase/permease subunit
MVALARAALPYLSDAAAHNVKTSVSTDPDQSGKQDSKLATLWHGLKMLDPAERKRCVLLSGLIVLSGMVDLLALGSAMPFIAMLVDVQILEQQGTLRTLHQLVGSPDYGRFVAIVGAVSLLLVLLSAGLSFLVQRAANRFAASCQARLARDIMTKLVEAPYAWFLTINSSAVAHVLNRDATIWARDLILKILTALRDMIMILLPLGLVIAAMPLAGIGALATIAILIYILLLPINPRVVAVTRVKQSADAQAHALSAQALTGIKDIKISGRSEKFTDTFADAYGRFTNSHARLTNLHQIPASAITAAGQFGLFAIAMTLWSIGTDRAELVAQLALLVLVTSRILPAANRLAGATTNLLGVIPAVASIRSLIATGGFTGPSSSTGDASIHRGWRQLALENVSFFYPGSAHAAITDVSLRLDRDLTCAFVGRSGSGKTTIVDIIAGLLTPSQGRLAIDGRTVSDTALTAWQMRVRYVPQSPFIMDDSLRANVAFGVSEAQVDETRLQQALEAADLCDLVRALPAGASTQVGDRGVRLSGGQRQRVAIARALYDEADLLVLDEATSALDAMSERSVQDAIERLRGRVTTVMIAHRFSTIRNCDRIFLVDDGRLVAEGNWSTLMASNALFRQLAQDNNGD